MRHDVKIPKWGLTIERMIILGWTKAIGDRVEKGDGLCEVETDKADAEIEAPVGGVLVEQLGEVGTDYRVGEVIAVIDTG